MAQVNERELCNRALAAYWRTANRLGGIPLQPNPPEMIEYNELKYIVLSNVNGTLAVYRVRIVNGEPVLKGLKRWPKEVAE
jgi:hypothetical protein